MKTGPETESITDAVDLISKVEMSVVCGKNIAKWLINGKKTDGFI